MTSLVYFSSVSENTHRFVQHLGLPATRIPIHDRDGSFRVNEPYVLILPTYGGGVTVTGRDTSYVPKPVIRFLNNPHNRSLIRAVIAAGNTNFGESFCYAGNIISQNATFLFCTGSNSWALPKMSTEYEKAWGSSGIISKQRRSTGSGANHH